MKKQEAIKELMAAMVAMTQWMNDVNQRLDAIETAVGDLQGTKEITDVPLTDALTEIDLDYVASQELASWERFNTRFENLLEQGGPYDD